MIKKSILSFLLIISSFQAIAEIGGTIIFVNNMKVGVQANVVIKKAQKGDLIGISPHIVDDVCDFDKQIYVNNYDKNTPTTAYCSYVGYARELINNK